MTESRISEIQVTLDQVVCDHEAKMQQYLDAKSNIAVHERTIESLNTMICAKDKEVNLFVIFKTKIKSGSYLKCNSNLNCATGLVL